MQRGLAGEILSRLERRGLRIIGLKLMQVDEDLARRHYAEHEARAFFDGLVGYITSSPVIAAVFEGITRSPWCGKTVSETNPAEAEPGTIRGDLALEMGADPRLGRARSPRSARSPLFFGEDLCPTNAIWTAGLRVSGRRRPASHSSRTTTRDL